MANKSNDKKNKRKTSKGEVIFILVLAGIFGLCVLANIIVPDIVKGRNPLDRFRNNKQEAVSKASDESADTSSNGDENASGDSEKSQNSDSDDSQNQGNFTYGDGYLSGDESTGQIPSDTNQNENSLVSDYPMEYTYDVNVDGDMLSNYENTTPLDNESSSSGAEDFGLDPAVVGNWSCNMNGYDIRYTFNFDGSGYVEAKGNRSEISWATGNGYITIGYYAQDVLAQSEKSSYTMSSDKMILSGDSVQGSELTLTKIQ